MSPACRIEDVAHLQATAGYRIRWQWMGGALIQEGQASQHLRTNRRRRRRCALGRNLHETRLQSGRTQTRIFLPHRALTDACPCRFEPCNVDVRQIPFPVGVPSGVIGVQLRTDTPSLACKFDGGTGIFSLRERHRRGNTHAARERDENKSNRYSFHTASLRGTRMVAQ